MIFWPVFHRKVTLPLYLARYPRFKKGVETLEEIQRRARKTNEYEITPFGEQIKECDLLNLAKRG